MLIILGRQPTCKHQDNEDKVLQVAYKFLEKISLITKKAYLFMHKNQQNYDEYTLQKKGMGRKIMIIRILYLFLCSIQSLGIKPDPHVNLFHNDSCSHRNINIFFN